MNKILKVRNVNDYARYVGAEEQHPLVSVIDYAEVSPVRHSLNDYGVYGIFFHDEAEIDLAYGCGKCSIAQTGSVCRPTISAMSSRRPPATQRAATSASSSFS